ncbi:SipW-dependent-type signal peptide-containing protein [Salinigranum salinum]|uniref:SipW-dependent-type signal peptide-containing protein n=1 Tax=Salinigranum salinum TaxID=1364937 RepID=UPI0012611D42|nr:SipW-dependent-type signal peptide-containing protein [Salinigranum salinum]
MTDKFDISRRKMLGAMGTIGGAAALGGASTLAFFSDSEEFANSQLTAGELDLKVDWSEHYSDWSEDETAGLSDWSMTDSSVGPGFPSAAATKSIYVSDSSQFLENTAIEAYPDPDNDAIQEGEFPDGSGGSTTDICESPSDLPTALNNGDWRTTGPVPAGNDGANQQTTEAGDPLVEISDVKPGDFGEVTFSLHLCGNPGFVWLTGDLVEASENGKTEPEEDDGDEGPGVELLDEIQAAVWYDTGADGQYGTGDMGEGDNYKQAGESFTPLTGSLRRVLAILRNGMLPLDYTPGSGGSGGTGGSGGGGATIVSDASAALGASPYTNSDLGIDQPSNISCSALGGMLDEIGFSERPLVGTKFEPGSGGDFDLSPGTYNIAPGSITIESVNVAGGTISLTTDFAVETVMVKGGKPADGENVWVFDDDGVRLSNVQFSIPDSISHVEVCYEPSTSNGGNGGLQQNGRECFPNSTTVYLGFEWWLPVDHANEIQTDSVSFDLGFYTEQCRHNDGQMGNNGAGGGGGPDNGTDGGQAISFIAWCTDGDASALNPTIDEELAFDDDGDPSSVRWSTDAGVDRVVVFYASRVTIYEYDSPVTGDVATTGTTSDGSGVTVTDRDANLPEDANNPCGDLNGVKVEF